MVFNTFTNFLSSSISQTNVNIIFVSIVLLFLLLFAVNVVIYVVYSSFVHNDDKLFLHRDKNFNKELMKKKNNVIACKKMVILSSFLIFVTYVLWRLIYAMPLYYGFIALSLSVLLLIVEVVEFISQLMFSESKLNIISYKTPNINDDEFPEVDILIPTYNEPEELIRKNLINCKKIYYPDKSKVHIFLCDDSARANIKSLALEMDVIYCATNNNKKAKAGNLNNALKQGNSPYILTLDCDMIPKRNILLKLVPYFISVNKKNECLSPDKKIKLGFVQAPQSFYRPDIFQNCFNLEHKVMQENNFFFRYEELGKNYENNVTYCGTNAVISRKALEDVGGFYTEALTEDLPTGLLIRSKGYTNIAVQDVVAEGVAPYNYEEYLKQRTRWTFGNVGGMRQLRRLKKNLSGAQRRSWDALDIFWHSPLLTVFTVILPIVTAIFNINIFDCDIVGFVVFWIGFYLVKFITFTVVNDKKTSLSIERIRSFALSFMLFFPILLDTIGFHYKKATVSKKDISKKVSLSKNLLWAIPLLVIVVFSIYSLYVVLWINWNEYLAYHFVLAFWLLYNICYSLLALKLIFTNTPVHDGIISTEKHNAFVYTKEGNKINARTTKMSEKYINLQISKFSYWNNDVIDVYLEDNADYFDIECRFINYDNLTDICTLEILPNKNYEDYISFLYNDNSYLQHNPNSISLIGIVWNLIKYTFVRKDIDRFY